MENNKDQNQPDSSAKEQNSSGRNWDSNKKMDIDPNLGGPFTYSENQDNDSIHTIPDDNVNPESREVEGLNKRNDK